MQRGRVQREAWFSYGMASASGAISGARHRFEEWLATQGVDGETCEDMAVVLSELGANAVAAAAGGGSRIDVRAWREGSVLVIEVENAGSSGPGGVVFHHENDPLRGHGQGLVIVAAYTDSVEVVPPLEGAGLVVRCRKEL